MGNTVRWYWSADTLFCQLSIDHNIDVQSASSWAPRVVRKWESKHWFSCGLEGRPGAVGWCIVTWLPNFLGWVDLQSYEAPAMRTLHACGAPLWRTITKINSSNKCSYWYLNPTWSQSHPLWVQTWVMVFYTTLLPAGTTTCTCRSRSYSDERILPPRKRL